MKIVIDMNLSPDWAEVLQAAGWESVHWSAVGDIRATDEIIMSWARENGFIVFTHDLDFGILLALTRAESPSVIRVLREQQSALESGALVTVDEDKTRVRVLPFR